MDYLNSLDRRKAAVVLRKCLPSSVWVEAMVIRRPFASIDDATSAARDVAASLREVEWNEVFASVKFVSEVISVKKDKENKIISGDPQKIKKVNDTWKFCRNIKSQNPNWQLIETEV